MASIATLTTGRKTPKRGGSSFIDRIGPVPMNGSSARIYVGSGVIANASGYADAPTATTGLTSLGVLEEVPGVDSDFVENTGSAGDVSIQVSQGEFKFDNSVSDAVVQGDLGKACYWEDDHTVCHTGTGKSLAGTVTGLDASTDVQSGAGVWVAVGVPPIGLTGSAGATGPTGATGPSGGPTGPTGPTGP